MIAKRIAMRFSVLVGITAVITGSILLASSLLAPYIRIGLNTSDSLPGFLYVIYPGNSNNLTQGETIGFYPPENPFYPRMVFIKKVAGLPGDTVTFANPSFAGEELFINGVKHGMAKAEAKTGEPLPHIQPVIIPPDYYFVWTSHPDSFDSRYAAIGLIPKSEVIGRAQRIF